MFDKLPSNLHVSWLQEAELLQKADKRKDSKQVHYLVIQWQNQIKRQVQDVSERQQGSIERVCKDRHT